MAGIIKQTRQTAADEARKIAKQLRQEPMELAKTVVPPAIIEGGKRESSSPITEAILKDQEKSQEVAINEEEMKQKTDKRLQELEDEIKKIRQEREAKEREWTKSQDDLMQPGEPEKKPFVAAQSRKKRGFMGPAKHKQGTQEMGKRKSG